MEKAPGTAPAPVLASVQAPVQARERGLQAWAAVQASVPAQGAVRRSVQAESRPAGRHRRPHLQPRSLPGQRSRIPARWRPLHQELSMTPCPSHSSAMIVWTPTYLSNVPGQCRSSVNAGGRNSSSREAEEARYLSSSTCGDMMEVRSCNHIRPYASRQRPGTPCVLLRQGHAVIGRPIPAGPRKGRAARPRTSPLAYDLRLPGPRPTPRRHTRRPAA